MWASLEMRVALSFVAGIGGFCIAYMSGNKSKAILIPASIAGICWMIPVLMDPKAGLVGSVLLMMLASLPFCLAAAVGCFAGIHMRYSSQMPNRSSIGRWVAIGVLVAAVVFAGFQLDKDRKFKSFLAFAQVSGAVFLRQNEEVLSKTGQVVKTSVFSAGHNQYDLPLVTYYVSGEKMNADVQVEASGTEFTPVYSIRAIVLRPK